MMSSSRQVGAERSLLNDTFTGGDDFVKGAILLFNDSGKAPLRGSVSFTDGTNTRNQNFQDYPTNNYDFGTAGRVEYKLFGDWKDYGSYSSYGMKDPLLVVGGGVSFNQAGDFDNLLQTADIQFNAGPLGLYGAYYGRSLTHAGVGGGGGAKPASATAGLGDFYDYGFLGQASYQLTKKFEVFGRYDLTRFNSREFAAGTEDIGQEISLGVNYYFYGHQAKVTVDGTYLPTGTPVSDGGADILKNNGHSEYVLRAQFQLLL